MSLTKASFSMINGAYVNVLDYGVVGDGVTDDTIGINAAIVAANATNKRLYFPAATGNYKITAALTEITSFGGVDMESMEHQSINTSGLLVSGTGYTAVTISGSPTIVNLAVFGTGNTANGILFKNPYDAKIGKLRVDNLNGYGVKINRCFDCTFTHISVQSCGNATEYAFSMNDDGDTCNMTHIGHLQVELANSKAIYVSPNSLSLVIDSVHSERLTPNASYTAWVLGGGSSQYNSVRLNSSGTSANAKALLNGIDTTYVSLRAEDNIPVTVDCSGGSAQLIGPKIFGTYAETTSQTGQVNIYGGVITAIAVSGQVSNTHYFGVILASVVEGISQEISYVPAITASGSAFSLGNGDAVGAYSLVGNRVRTQVSFTMGSTTTFGSGTYSVSLPFTSANNSLTSLGTSFFNDSGTGLNAGIVRVVPASSTATMWTGSVPATQVGTTSPQTFAVNDQIFFDIEFTRA